MVVLVPSIAFMALPIFFRGVGGIVRVVMLGSWVVRDIGVGHFPIGRVVGIVWVGVGVGVGRRIEALLVCLKGIMT
jgi:hypothetical protein